MIPPRLRWRVRRLLMRAPLGRRLWWRLHGAGHEIGFWSAWFELRGASWSAEYARRVADAPLIEDALVTGWLDALERPDVSILDVGAGPITRLGTRYPGKSVTVVPVDPLADTYDELLRRHGIEPPVRTIKAFGERLLDHFAPASFDVAYAANSIDHSAEPVQIVRNMLALVKPDGAVLLRHVRNEGEHRRYSGLHQWNFDVEGGDLVVWNNARRDSLRDALGGRAIVEAWVEGDEVLARLRPRPVAGG